MFKKNFQPGGARILCQVVEHFFFNSLAEGEERNVFCKGSIKACQKRDLVTEFVLHLENNGVSNVKNN